MNYPNYPQIPQYNEPVAARIGGSRGAAKTAAILACIMFVLRTLFYGSLLNKPIGDFLLNITNDFWGATVIYTAFLFIYAILGIFLGISIIKMTRNNPGTIAGSIYLFIKIVAFISILFLSSLY